MQTRLKQVTENIQDRQLVFVEQHIISTVELLSRVDQDIAQKYATRSLVDIKMLDFNEMISKAFNMAFHAWSSINVLPCQNKTEEELMAEAVRNGSFSFYAEEPNISLLAKKIFMALSPYVRLICQNESMMIDTISWCDNLGNDIMLEVSKIKLW